ncbi:50S ribosomal protein L19 [Candidatus Similichlamydia epinepheli]|uniref:50S ribosomal protein L19 n=1 Tax=Candidatus Similichlamydia epinepheli TaxID=1903953 RepID=UPI000D3A1E35|nr:50S ribosomal protein L19 [Candidatus Similichlamydia epinepheli]
MVNKYPKVLNFENQFKRKDPLVPLRIGDSVTVYVRIKEGDKSRTQMFLGTLIGKSGGGLSSAFVVRRVTMGEAIEYKFFEHSPLLIKVEVLSHGVSRRAKLNFLRGCVGKKSRLRQVSRRSKSVADE